MKRNLCIPRLFAVALTLGLVVPLAPGAAQNASPLPITAKALTFDSTKPGRTTTGALEWRGGLRLFSDDPKFGGWSALSISADGTELLSLSDHGYWLSARLRYDQQGLLAGITDSVIGPLRDAGGAWLKGKQRGDAESLARDGKGGYFVSFERDHRIWHYPKDDRGPLISPPVNIPLSPDFRDQPANGGLEAMARLADGRLLLLSERHFTAPDQLGGWIGRVGHFQPLTWQISGASRPSGAAALPDGGLIVVERRLDLIRGATVRLSHVPAALLRPGAVLRGKQIAVLAEPLPVDNIEGISVRPMKDGSLMIYLVSDDNYNPAQRTLLLAFRLAR